MFTGPNNGLGTTAVGRLHTRGFTISRERGCNVSFVANLIPRTAKTSARFGTRKLALLISGLHLRGCGDLAP